MSDYRSALVKTVLGVLCQVTRDSSKPIEPGFFRARILGGPLRNALFTMPGLERLSFVLGTYESHVTGELEKLVKPGMVVYDIGANAGYLTLVLARLVGDQGQVHAFEPGQRNLYCLDENKRLNHRSNITIVPKAVSKETGTCVFATFDYSLVGHIATEQTPEDAKLVEVDAISLDQYCLVEGQPLPDLIKIDVEGAEDQVLLGAQEILRKKKPVILAEVRDGVQFSTIKTLMDANGYACLNLHGGWEIEKDHLGDMLFVPQDAAGQYQRS